MLNKIAFIYTEAKEQNDLFTPHHTKFDCAIQYGTNCKPFEFPYQCNIEYVQPNIRDIMECLMLDAQVYDCEYADAKDMADGFGYDYFEEQEKVDNMWNACKRASEALHRMFTQDELDELAEEINE